MGTSSIDGSLSSFLLFQLPQRCLPTWSLRRWEEKGGREERRAEGIEVEVAELEVSLLFSFAFVLRTSRIEANKLICYLSFVSLMARYAQAEDTEVLSRDSGYGERGG